MATGSPIAAALILLAAYAIADWYTFGFLRGVARAVANLRRGRRLEMVLLHNPHDRKARADLGDILLQQRRHRRAIEVVKPLADADPHDLHALWMLGIACLGTGRISEGELFLTEIHKAQPEFRDGAALLELGRARLKRGEPTALAPLREYVALHPHAVEARSLLASAFQLAGDLKEAAAERDRCWKEYVTSLPYHRRRDRLWAWRARPSRPLLYAAVACAAVLVFGSALGHVQVPAAHAADVRSMIDR